MLRRGIEILQTGEVHVHRPDREWLAAVRDGLFTQGELRQAAEHEARLAAAPKTTRLPAEPGGEAAGSRVVELQERVYGLGPAMNYSRRRALRRCPTSR